LTMLSMMLQVGKGNLLNRKMADQKNQSFSNS